MRTEEKYQKIIELLHSKIMNNQLNWIKTEREGVFQTSLTDFIVRITENPELFGRQSLYFIELYDNEGNKIDGISTLKLEDKNTLILFKEIYEKARRIAMGADQALDKLLASLEA